MERATVGRRARRRWPALMFEPPGRGLGRAQDARCGPRLRQRHRPNCSGNGPVSPAVHPPWMDDRRVGRVVREVRIRRGWRQHDLASAASVSQSLISRVELGQLEHVSLDRLRAVGAALDIAISIDVWWRAGELDRLVDRGHASLVEYVVGRLHELSWVTRVEVTFNNFGERGSADIVAWHAATRTLLIIEVKTRIGDVQATVSTFERKVRILPDVLAREEGWNATTVGRLLVIADTHANRSVVREHRRIFDSIWPERTAATRRWIRTPSLSSPGDRRGFGGIWFLPYRRLGATATRVRQVQRVRPRTRSGR
jgi:transcriptional regulator with XRE-family HTH domain